MAIAEKTTSSWSSRPAFLLAAIGGAVGLGNLWRFPYIAGEYGGGGFVLIYLGFVFLLGVPLMAGEMMLGRRGHRSPVNSIAALVRAENASLFWRSIGWISLLVPFIGLSYYAVVAAWAIDYLVLAGAMRSSGLMALRRGTLSAPANRRACLPGNTARFFCRDDRVGRRTRRQQGYRTGIQGAHAGACLASSSCSLSTAWSGRFRRAARFLFNPDFSS